MRYTKVKDPQWNHDGSMVNCIVDFAHIGEVPFAASPTDALEHGREIYARCIAGDFGPIAEYVPAPDEGPQEPTPPELLHDDMRIPTTNTGGGNTNQVL